MRRDDNSHTGDISSEIYQVLFDTTNDLIFTLASDTRITSLNRAFETMTGWKREEWLGKPFPPLVHPEDLPLAMEMFTLVMSGKSTPIFQVRLLTKSEEELFTQYSAVPYIRNGEVEMVLGIGRDITEQKRNEEQLKLRESQLAEAQRLAQIGSWEWNLKTNELRWSDELYHIYGIDPETFEATYEAYLTLIHPDDLEYSSNQVQHALETHGPFHNEQRIIRPDKSIRYVERRGAVMLDANGEAERMVGTSQDITERKLLEQQQEQLVQEKIKRAELEASQRSLSFLANVGLLLDASLDYEATLTSATQLAVPQLADWCAIDVLTPQGTIKNVATTHTDPEKIALAAEFRELYPIDPNDPGGVCEVIRTGQPQIYPDVPEELIRASIQDPKQLEMTLNLGICSVMIIPMSVGKRTLGALTLVSAESGRRFGEQDQVLAYEFARRAAAAVDNAQLFTERNEIAETLQKSLLPEQLPHFEGLKIATRFEPFGDGVEVGGDFYDFFSPDSERLFFSIGDVCGKGIGAATLTALAKYTIRANSAHLDSPKQVLEHLSNALMLQPQRLSLCTAIFGRVERTPTGVHLTFASGGHPLPIILRADGRAEEIGNPGTLLGTTLRSQLIDVDLELSSGETLIFYTDGLTEAYAPKVILDSQDIMQLVRDSVNGTRDPEHIADRLINHQLSAEQRRKRRDDVAIVVMQVGD